MNAEQGRTELTGQLAVLADELVVRPAPVDALVRGGRQRRVRRRAVIGAAALAFVLPLGGVLVWTQDGGSSEVRYSDVSSQPAKEPGVLEPVRTVVGTVTGAIEAEARVTMYAGPRTQEEADKQMEVAGGNAHFHPEQKLGESTPPRDVRLGQSWYALEIETPRSGSTGTTAYVPERVGDSELRITGHDGGLVQDPRLWVGWVGPGIGKVEIHWADGSKSTPQLVTPGGADIQWFLAASAEKMATEYIELTDADGVRHHIEPKDYTELSAR